MFLHRSKNNTIFFRSPPCFSSSYGPHHSLSLTLRDEGIIPFSFPPYFSSSEELYLSRFLLHVFSLHLCLSPPHFSIQSRAINVTVASSHCLAVSCSLICSLPPTHPDPLPPPPPPPPLLKGLDGTSKRRRVRRTATFEQHGRRWSS